MAIAQPRNGGQVSAARQHAGDIAHRVVVFPAGDGIDGGADAQALLRQGRDVGAYQQDEGIGFAALDRLSHFDVVVDAGRAGIDDHQSRLELVRQLQHVLQIVAGSRRVQ